MTWSIALILFEGIQAGPLANAPTVSLITPTEGALISGTIEMTGEGWDDSAVTSVEVSVTPQGGPLSDWMVVPPGNINPVGGSASHVTWNLTWNSMSAKNGAYTVWARSFDDSTPSPIHSSYAQRNVTVENGPPSVTIDPQPSTVSGKITVTGSVAKAHAKRVLKVELLVIQSSSTMATIKASFTNTSGVWSATWDTTELSNGDYTLKARVGYDTPTTTPAFSNEITVKVDNPLTLWLILLIILLVFLLVVVIILVVIWVLDRRKVKALNLNPKDVKKESLLRRFLAFFGRRGKVYFLLKFEGATTLGSMHTIDMLAIRKDKEKGKFLEDILGKVSYRIMDKDATIHVFSVNDWAMKKRHPHRILLLSRKFIRKNGMRTASVEVYDTDQFAREKAEWLERSRFRKEGEDVRTGTRKQRFVLTIRKG
jgi:TRAP-type C4-dicarboxylate transport system permease small subunit